MGDDPTDVQKAQAAEQQDAIAKGRDALNTAKSLAQQAKEMRQSAQRECSDVLNRAADEAIPPRNVFHRIRDFFKDFPLVKIILGLLIAVVAVFFPVVGVLLGGVLFAVDQIAAISDGGKVDLAGLGIGLASLVPGAGLLGRFGAIAARGAGAVSKAVGSARGAGGSIKDVGATLGSTKVVGAELGAGRAGTGLSTRDKVANKGLDLLFGEVGLTPLSARSVAKGVVKGAALSSGVEVAKEVGSDVVQGRPVKLSAARIGGAAIGGAVGGVGGAVVDAGKVGRGKRMRTAGQAAAGGVNGVVGESVGEALAHEPLDPTRIAESGAAGAATSAARTGIGLNIPRRGGTAAQSPHTAPPMGRCRPVPPRRGPSVTARPSCRPSGPRAPCSCPASTNRACPRDVHGRGGGVTAVREDRRWGWVPAGRLQSVVVNRVLFGGPLPGRTARRTQVPMAGRA
ncbi:hypothetical protein LO771_29895 [Streptacidiphilus sp. ASG 303]|uniref:hypothetical protein n=1 Tax=Streptacidiphilus sp. ASG 303 TaxID=2896847 RepID=UPI001E4BFCBB|nr:hypothetical protein [Streptacidiphilus sp. ASG 303]MCD0486479.1 hypothetical protein [Streptacidiphilus sp. ASG 303]